jgi:hypothetical protein
LHTSGSRWEGASGQSARETTSGRFYFDVDDGWLWRGMQGNNGLTITDRGLQTQDITKPAPTIYMRIEYLDRGKDTFSFEYNKMEEWTYQQTTTDPKLQTIRLTNMWANPGQQVTKTDTGTWKTAVITFDPATNAFGAYNGQHLIADFLIDDNDGTEVVHSVMLSTTPNFVLPSPARDILRVVGGLDAATTPEQRTALDLNGDGKITAQDAAIAARQAQGL